MKTRKLGDTGLDISAMGLGCKRGGTRYPEPMMAALNR
jgi:aryl-alcohol dehydrogenase-like predicted oxidoreductase